jgi:ribosomal protein L24E
MKVLLIMIMTTGYVQVLQMELKSYEFCSDKVEHLVETHNIPVQVHWCETLDRKYYVSYYNPEWEKNKSFDILD